MKKFSKKGYVYILSNPLFRSTLLKIGMTTRTPEQRAMEMYEGHTGVPNNFTVEFKKEVANCEFAEEVIHHRLDNFRVNEYREFFEINIEEAKKIINEVCKDVEKIFGKPPIEAYAEERKSHDDQYITYDSGVVYDSNTGLEWYHCGEKMSCEDAIECISSLNVGGDDDWRMPNNNELKNLYKPGVGGRGISFTGRRYVWCICRDGQCGVFNFDNGFHYPKSCSYYPHKVFGVRNKSL